MVTEPTNKDVATDLFYWEPGKMWVTYEEYMKLKYGIVQDEPMEDEPTETLETPKEPTKLIPPDIRYAKV